MKQFSLSQEFPIASHILFDFIFGNTNFKQTFHSSKGDKDVIITDWIQISQNIKQRVCFFTMIENEGKNEFDITRCLETQKVTSILPIGNTNLSEYLIDCSVVPENPMGSAMFKVDSKWKIIPITGNETTKCEMSVLVVVECTKKIWGVSNMVENLLEKQAQESHMKWIQMADRSIKDYINELNKNLPREIILNQEVQQNLQAITRDSPSDVVRFRLSTLKRVVHGTEKIAQIFNHPSFHSSISNNSQVNLTQTLNSTSTMNLPPVDNSVQISIISDQIDNDDKEKKISSQGMDCLSENPRPSRWKLTSTKTFTALTFLTFVLLMFYYYYLKKETG